jgi:hypothetical protein
MGFDICVTLIHGYRLRLSDCRNIIDLSILEGDDWQVIHEMGGLDREEMIRRYVTNNALREWLVAYPRWNLQFLTSSQEDPDLENSYVFIFDHREQLFYGRVPDYETGPIETRFKPPGDCWPPIDGAGQYQQHWIVEGSW